ncbi:MAG: MBL fold metallo-hydrolase [Clostridia bacterium]|nr:MBL fold metallo-hydrolase [Clostridia bacterium]
MSKLYMLTETSKFMMSFVIVTENDQAIVVDGGRPADMPLLKQYVGGRHIAAWILTHAHNDHITGFISEMQKNGGADWDIGTVYYNFPPYSLIDNHDVPDYKYMAAELNECLPAFFEVEPLFHDKAHVTAQGETVQIDDCRIDFLFSYHEGLTVNLMNDSSLVFKVTTPQKSVLFLGDLGPQAGDILYRESRHLLQADIVQMAHHGHMNVGMEVYAAVGAEACLWCAPEWLYNEEEIPDYLKDPAYLAPDSSRLRMYGTRMTRNWMDILGAKTHYVTMNGTQEIDL